MTRKTLVMGILNVTPDSFSDGGKFNNIELALNHVNDMINQGADIIDIGAESTRPGAISISSDEEIDRLIPILDAINNNFKNIKISVDTKKPTVMQEALKRNIWMINDVSGFDNNSNIDAVKNSKAKICIMHMQKKPENMQDNPTYDDIIKDINDFFHERIEKCINNGIDRDRIFIDPGVGFGKTLEHNKSILKNIPKFNSHNLPILVGMSRKSMLGDILNKPVNDRLYGGLAAAVIACINGVSVIRTHDVAATVDAIKVTEAIRNSS